MGPRRNKRNAKPLVSIPDPSSYSQSKNLDPFGIGEALKQNITPSAVKLEPPHISLRYYDHDFECFSEWVKAELKSFTQLINKISKSNWVDIPKQDGLGYTMLDISTLKNATAKSKINSLKKTLSADINFFELRVTKKARIHGFKVNETFHLVFLDRGHKVCPM